jgi:hypothetical protein
VTASPAIEAVVVSLGYDLAILEFRNIADVCAHFAICRQRAEGNSKPACPENFLRNLVAAYYVVLELIPLPGEQLAALFKRFGLFLEAERMPWG